jgi:hypothetical protein
LTYRIFSYPGHLQPSHVNTVLEQAFAAWASITKFHFRQILTLADINIAFRGTNHSHFHPFRPEEYGHAFFAPTGSVEFNEDWSRDNTSHSGQYTHSVLHALSGIPQQLQPEVNIQF